MSLLPERSPALAILICALTLLAGCGGGGGEGGSAPGTTTTTTTTTGPTTTQGTVFELRDPTPGAGDQFGQHVAVLSNGNIVVTDPNDASIVPSGGAVHLYRSSTRERIASIYGDVAFDQLGSGGITVLNNDNIVISSPLDDELAVVDAGSVRLMSGVSGTQVGNVLMGDSGSDSLSSGGVKALGNSNFAIVSPQDDENGVIGVGSVMLISGISGNQIGATIAGDTANDNLGSGGVKVLVNHNFVVVSPVDDENGVVDAGSVKLIDGVNGAQIGASIVGDIADDFSGLTVTELVGNNFVLASPDDDISGVVNAGSVRLLNGLTAVQIGGTLSGDNANDLFGTNVTALVNGHFVIASHFDDENGLINVGSVVLVDGVSGTQIGNAIVGDADHDSLGSEGVFALPNNHYVIASANDDEGGMVNAGSVRLVNGNDGVPIGAVLTGNNAGDFFGLATTNQGITVLPNGNFVIASRFDDVGGITDAGSLRLINGLTGVQIGGALAGDVANDNLGFGNIIALGNSNVVVTSVMDDENSIVDAGSVRLLSGVTGAQIGATISGDVASDVFAAKGKDVLADHHCVIILPFDDHEGTMNAGSIRLLNSGNGTQIGNTIVGSAMGDMELATSARSASGDFYVLGLAKTNRNNLSDTGVVWLIRP